MRPLSWSQRSGVALTVPCLLLAFALAAQAIWDARPLPQCLSNGLDPFNPAQKCRRVTMVSGVDVTAGVGSSPLEIIERGSVSGMPDLQPAGAAALAALMLYLTSWGLGRLLGHRVRPSPK